MEKKKRRTQWESTKTSRCGTRVNNRKICKVKSGVIQSEVLGEVSAYKNLLKKHFQLEEVYLFGSYANGTPDKDSDIDVGVVVKSLKGDYFSNTPLLWKLRREIDDRIKPIFIQSDFDDGDFLGEVKKHGIEV